MERACNLTAGVRLAVVDTAHTKALVFELGRASSGRLITLRSLRPLRSLFPKILYHLLLIVSRGRRGAGGVMWGA